MIGETVSHYRILEKLGEGGMGIVYVAEDTLLGRRVAIKTLTSARGSANQHFRTRFLREARAASKLSHPHIATIHDYGETPDGQPYIVMELVQGKTLSDVIREESLTIPRTIKIVSQVAEALSEAHRHGLVHRDIKPSNIAITERGSVKVLDFGLAKEIVAVASDDGLSSPPANTQTREGIVVGTPMYLSPEQALGLPVDARSDIFSLGSVMYECLTGQPAFAGNSDADICAKVIRDDPTRPSLINGAVSGDLEQVALMAVAKKPTDRYQSANELVQTLETVASRWNGQSLNEPPVVAGVTVVAGINKRFGHFINRRHVLAILFGAAVIAIGLFLLASNRSKLPPPIEQSRLTISGSVKEAAISPDGNYVAYVMDEVGLRSVLLRQVATANELVLVPPSSAKYKGLSFSPTQDYVYYLLEDGDSATLCKVSTLGGSSRKLISNVDTPVSFSPQGDRMTFVRISKPTGSTSLIISNSEGGEERNVATLKEPQLFSHGGYYSSGPAWSPDGQVIAVPAFSVTDNSHREVVIVSVADGKLETIRSQSWSVIEKVVWLADGSGFLMNAADTQSPSLQIWFVTYPQGVARRITQDPNNYIGLSTSKDSGTILTTRRDRISSLWINSSILNSSSSQIPSTRDIGTSGISWSNDGKLVFSSNISGNYAIWVMDADGSNRKQLTFDNRTNMEPETSPDGRYIVYVSFEGRHPHLWRMNADGNNPIQLTSGGDEDLPRFTPDGKWVVYHSIKNTRYSIQKISVDGGDPVELVKETSTQPDVSPDGKLVACFAQPENSTAWKMIVAPIEGGAHRAVFDLPAGVDGEWPGLRWSPDGRSLIYVTTEQGVSNIWSQPLAGGEPTALTAFKESRIFFFDWSSVKDPKLALVRGYDTRDLVLIRKFQ